MPASSLSRFRGAQPLYVKMASHLADAIASGKYPVGSLIPPEGILCRQFNTSRFTVREAIKQLRELGIVATRHGTGTEVVSRQPRSKRFTYSFDSIQEFRRSVGQTRLVNIASEEVTADRGMADAFRCPVGDALLRVTSTRVLVTAKGRPGKPVALSIVLLPAIYADVLQDIGASLDQTVMDLLEQHFGVRTARIEQTIEPYSFDKAEGQKLGVPTGSIGLRFQRTYLDSQGRAFQHAISLQAGDEAQLRMTIRAAASK